MKIKELNIDGRKILFINAYRGTGSGFIHETELYIDGWEATTAICHYINRTWERYAFQSVMLEAVLKLQEEEKERAARAYKREHGCKNIIGPRKIDFLEQLKTDQTLLFYKKIEEALR